MKPAIVFVIDQLTQLYLLVLLLRFWLPWVRADFRNAFAQVILKLTSPLVIPVRRVIPSIGRLDTATVLVAFAIKSAALALMLAIINVSRSFADIAITAALELGILSAVLFLFAIIIYVILSWFAPGAYNPGTALLSMIVRPLLDPFSRIVPRLGGIDVSPIIVIILLQATMMVFAEYRPINISP